MNEAISYSKTRGVLLFVAIVFAYLPVMGGVTATQGIYVKNQTLRKVRVEFFIDGVKHTFKMLPGKRLYLFTRGAFTEEFMFFSDALRGKVRNLSVGFVDDLPPTSKLRQPRLATAISEGERTFLHINFDDFEQGSLLEVPNTIKEVRMLEYGFD
jgi:hypothetical protein